MIIQSPESAMPEPFKTYVRQRSEAIAKVLQDVVGDSEVQLCPRAITPDEQFFADGIVYGAIVDKPQDGYKSVLYSTPLDSHGISTSNVEIAASYGAQQFKKGNRVRIKDPRESDGQGQFTLSSDAELASTFASLTNGHEYGAVLMPRLEHVQRRISVGRIALGSFGKFTYVGHEQTTTHEGQEVYGGTTLGLFHSGSQRGRELAESTLGIPSYLTQIGLDALNKYAKLAVHAGRVSVDVIEGTTGSGETLRDCIDITPRVGGTTPAEVLAIREIQDEQAAVAFASSQLFYNPKSRPSTGLNFIDTDTLIINARIHGIRR